MTLVWEHAPCRENALIVLLALADWSNDDGVCWPSMEKLANKARVDRRSAQRIVRRLVQDQLITIEEGGGRARQHRYKVETAALCRPLENSDFTNSDIAYMETAALRTERATFPTQTATQVSPDPLVEPLEDPSIDPPYSGSEFLEALAAYDSTARQRKIKESPEQRHMLFKKLARWGEERATEALENAVAHSWRGVFEPKEGTTNGNRNGSNGTNQSRNYQTATERRDAELRGYAAVVTELREQGSGAADETVRRKSLPS